MDCGTPGFPVLHSLLELAQTHVHWVGDATQPSHPLSPTSPPLKDIYPFRSESVLVFPPRVLHKSSAPGCCEAGMRVMGSPNALSQGLLFSQGPAPDPTGHLDSSSLFNQSWHVLSCWDSKNFHGALSVSGIRSCVRFPWWLGRVVNPFQWLRICLPMQGTRIWYLTQEESTHQGATKPVHHHHRASEP